MLDSESSFNQIHLYRQEILLKKYLLVVNTEEVVFERSVLSIEVNVEKNAYYEKSQEGYADGVDDAMRPYKFFTGI